MLTFESTQHLGAASIVEKLTVSCTTPDPHGSRPDRLSLAMIQQGLPFKTVVHQVNTTDVQPTLGNCFTILVTGQLVV